MPHCPLCLEDLISIHTMRLHFKVTNLHETLAKYKCQERNCYRDFCKWKSFRKHLINSHKCFLHVSNTDVILSSVGNSSCQTMNSVDDSLVDSKNFEMLGDENPPLTPTNISYRLETSLLSFLGKLYAAPNLPRNHFQMILEDTREFLDEVLALVKPAILIAFNNKEDDNGFSHNLNLITQAVMLPFDTVRTEYKRLKVFMDAGHLINHQSFTVGDVVQNKRMDGRIIKQILKVTPQFIPLRKTLQTFFCLTHVYESFMQYVEKLEKDKHVLSNFIQGEYWQSKSTPCLPPEYQMLLENIFLALLSHASDKKMYTNSEVCRILIEEINYL